VNTSPHRLALAALAVAESNAFRLRFGAHASTDASPASKNDSPGFLDKIKSKFRGAMVAGIGAMKPLPLTSAVHIARASSYDEPLADILATQFAHFREACPAGGGNGSCSSRTGGVPTGPRD